MNFSYDDVIEFKHALAGSCGRYLHFHEGSDSQYFTLDKPANQNVRQAVAQYLEQFGAKAVFTPDGMLFSVIGSEKESVENEDSSENDSTRDGVSEDISTDKPSKKQEL